MVMRFPPAFLARLQGPLLILVWGFAIGLVLWASGIDPAIQVWLDENYVHGFNRSMRFIGELGKGSLQIGLCAAAALAWAGYIRCRKGQRCYHAVHWLLGVVPVFAVSGVLNWIVKFAVGRGRPKEFLWNDASPYAMSPFTFDAQWWSFPSGHSCSAFAIAVWLGLAFPRGRYVFWLTALVVSFSRFLSLTPHYLGDVIAGGALGAATAWTVWLCREEWQRQKKEASRGVVA